MCLFIIIEVYISILNSIECIFITNKRLISLYFGKISKNNKNTRTIDVLKMTTYFRFY